MDDLNLPEHWSRPVLTGLTPQTDGGRWPVRRFLGDEMVVQADLITEGHECIAAELLVRHEKDEQETVHRMALRYNDEYLASWTLDRLGTWFFRVRAWADPFTTWRDRFARRVESNDPEIGSELLVGAGLLKRSAQVAGSKDKKALLRYAEAMEAGDAEAALEEKVTALVQANDPRESMIESGTYAVVVDPVLARFAAWYEFFPRSAPRRNARRKNNAPHATLDDAAELLPRIRELGFDIVYLPPVHPIGHTHRKGKDNTPEAGPGEPGSPWAIGSEEGGHTAVHPDLGGLDAFDRFVARARKLDLHVAIDIAFQTSPDHPWVREHPDWFQQRPDGSIRYAENPPKKYQDVYPLDFLSQDREALWRELKSVFEFWIDRGVLVFRVDNPHTKPFAFWEWCIRELRKQHPDLIFLSEAFSRPKTMYELAKLGFNNSYTYFTWRNTKDELVSYCRELYDSEVGEFFRPNFWPNTPDILHEYLVEGGRPAHIVRLTLAATLSSAYGLYGPPFEHVDNQQHPDREEYANNEKYEVRSWNWNDPDSLQPFMRRLNRIRRENPALQQMRNLRFHDTDNPQLLACSKTLGDNRIVVVVNLDPHHEQRGWLSLHPGELGLPEDRRWDMHDLLDNRNVSWKGSTHYLRLDPQKTPVRIFRAG
ncbi:MAG: DUF3416 domain-containing protein [Bacteroidetes bacterium SB0662_bin_6]|nr:DUF3416 domain-containing protein [Bacteroidetes bacterium SB0668_bin_1]MYE05588.1 DUF3416 domain-containing protein [Bacteroidetes bacterium SB0662_bin_6]